LFAQFNVGASLGWRVPAFITIKSRAQKLIHNKTITKNTQKNITGWQFGDFDEW
jgi:hypothetical protein